MLTPPATARAVAEQIALLIVGPGDPTDTEGPNAIGLGAPRRAQWAVTLEPILTQALDAAVAGERAEERARCIARVEAVVLASDNPITQIAGHRMRQDVLDALRATEAGG